MLLHLHAHLPFVRHPEEPVFLEEAWLFEAITDTYLPLLMRLQRLVDEGVPGTVSMTLSPPLCEMLADPLLQDRYAGYLDNLCALIDQEVEAKEHTPFAGAAQMYWQHLHGCRNTMRERAWQLLPWFRALMQQGALEIITCTATHGYLPLMQTKQSQRAQVAIAVDNYRKHFEQSPQGIWLAECGYQPGVEELVAEYGIRYFFVDSHAFYYAEPQPRQGVYAPVFCPNGVAAFARDPESSRSVWSAQAGYPGDPVYREFYRDLGYDGDYNYIKSHLHPDGIRRDLGLKYHAVTGSDCPLHAKQPYDPAVAHARARQHGEHFLSERRRQINDLQPLLGDAPVIVSPYDAELFGHWWFEGPEFIEAVLRGAARSENPDVRSGGQILADEPVLQVSTPSESSWGDNGYHGVWLNPLNDWVYPHLHIAEERMRQAARLHPNADGLKHEVLQQMARELVLAQSSDWTFIMTTQTSPSYAARRVRDHINRFTGLFEALLSNQISQELAGPIAWRDSIFQEIDYRHYI